MTSGCIKGGQVSPFCIFYLQTTFSHQSLLSVVLIGINETAYLNDYILKSYVCGELGFDDYNP